TMYDRLMRQPRGALPAAGDRRTCTSTGGRWKCSASPTSPSTSIAAPPQHATLPPLARRFPGPVMVSTAAQAAQNKLMEAGLAFPGDFRGCTEQEIVSIEDHCRVRLPASYRDFLRVMGRRAGDFLVGSDYSFPGLLGFRGGA